MSDGDLDGCKNVGLGYVIVGARNLGVDSSTLELAAAGRSAVVFARGQTHDASTWPQPYPTSDILENGAYWYSTDKVVGFAESGYFYLANVDLWNLDYAGGYGDVNACGDRLSWRLDGYNPGFRAGCYKDSSTSNHQREIWTK
jgi:hypothetical protein